MPNIKPPYFLIYSLVGLTIISLLIFAPSPKIFSSVLSSTDTVNSTISLTIGGDIMLGRSVNTHLSRTKDYYWPLKYLQETFSQSDLSMVNLESPLIHNCPLLDTGMQLCGDASNVNTLVLAGIDIVTLANNHALDYGMGGLEQTINNLLQNNIAPTGIGHVIVKQVGDIKLGFVGLNATSNLPLIDTATDEVINTRLSEAKNLADIVIVYLHWGIEYTANPTTAQISLAHRLVDLGADLVVGSHPHWVQSSENYRGTPIYYSLGNAVFDQDWSEETKKGLIIKVYIKGSNIQRVEELPIYIKDFGQPHLTKSNNIN